jgi:hypothetical protein
MYVCNRFSTIFPLDLGTVLTVWYLFLFFLSPNRYNYDARFQI